MTAPIHGYLMQYENLACIIFLCLMILVSILASSTVAIPLNPSVGVKEGDWIEYNVNITGTGLPPPTHDVRWFRDSGTTGRRIQLFQST